MNFDSDLDVNVNGLIYHLERELKGIFGKFYMKVQEGEVKNNALLILSFSNQILDYVMISGDACNRHELIKFKNFVLASAKFEKPIKQ